MPKMLKRLQETTHGYPIGFTEETWDEALDKMVEGFEAAQRIIDNKYMDEIQPDWYEKIMAMDKVNKFDKSIFIVESNKKALEMIKADEELFKTSMKIFVDNYFGLWD
jgi:transcriptional regulator of acetoin/glycerol metabolism